MANAPAEFEGNGRKPCRYCKSVISAAATVCPVCQMKQSPLRNQLTFLSGVVGLVVFVSSAAVFLHTNIVAAYTRLVGANDEIEVRDFSSLRTMTIYNNSAEKLILNTVRIQYPGDRTVEVILDEDIASGEIGSVDLAKHIREQAEPENLADIGPDAAGALVDPTTRKDSGAIVDAVKNGDWRDFVVEAVTRRGKKFQVYANKKVPYLAAPCQASLAYIVFKGETIFRKDLDCVGLVRLRRAKN